MLTELEQKAGAKFWLFLSGNCGKGTTGIASYVFGKDKGLYKLVGLKYLE